MSRSVNFAPVCCAPQYQKSAKSVLRGGGVSEVRLKAAHDGTYLYLLAVWPDKTRSFNRYWKYVGLAEWEKHVGEDAFSICWSPGSLQDEFREQGCALFCHNGKHVYDMNGETPRSTDFADICCSLRGHFHVLVVNRSSIGAEIVCASFSVPS